MNAGAMEGYFDELVARLPAMLKSGEHFTASFAAEQSDFVRFNHARIRQAGQVEQASINLQLICDGRHAQGEVTLSLDPGHDYARLAALISELRATLPDLAADPLFVLKTEVASSRDVRVATRTETALMVDEILSAAEGLDLVGFLANGPQQRGFADSFGQRNWHEVASFNFEWSLYHAQDKAVKTSYADLHWQPAAFAERMARAKRDLEVIRRPAKRLAPGAYRIFAAPAAMAEIIGMLGWGGFSEKARRTRQSPLQKLAEQEQALNPMIHMRENTQEGLAPAFQAEGYRRPPGIDLIRAGRSVASLISPRTAREYGVEQNGADANAEQPQSIDVAAGELAQADVLKQLGTGLYLNNLWYLNFSDRMNCRLTGMTRFAALWVEHGEIVAPCDVMRFDDSVYRMLGSNLEALTQERDFIPDASTYQARLTVSQRLPGALIDDFRFTL